MAAPDSPAVALEVPGLQRPLQMYLHGPRDLHVSKRIREQGIWEPYESALVLQLLGPGDVFVDVGANIGYFSLLAAAAVGEAGAVHAFEPDPENFALLQASASLNGLAGIVRARRAALSDRDGQARLFLSEDNLGDHQVFAAGEGRRSLPISLLRGDDALRREVRRIDLLKVDTQGAEYAVMAGLMPLLQELREPPRILIELTPLSLRQAGSSGRALIELLARLALPFWIVDHIEHRLAASSAGELADWCDAVDAVPGDAGFMNILVAQLPVKMAAAAI